MSGLVSRRCFGINNNTDEEKMQKTQSNHIYQKLHGKYKSRKSQAAHKSTIIREITGEKKRIITATLYNDTYNKLVLHHT